MLSPTSLSEGLSYQVTVITEHVLILSDFAVWFLGTLLMLIVFILSKCVVTNMRRSNNRSNRKTNNLNKN